MKIKINKCWWRLIFKPKVKHEGDDCFGVCWHRSRRIEVATDVDEKEIMDTIVHEMLHASDRNQKEEWVARTAFDITNALWRLGYRRPRE